LTFVVPKAPEKLEARRIAANTARHRDADLAKRKAASTLGAYAL